MSRKQIKNRLAALEATTTTPVSITSRVVTITGENDREPDPPKDARLLETKSPLVTVYRSEE